VTSMQTDLPELFDKPGENRNASNVIITIRDHGAGISPEQIKHLFEPFRTSKPAGTGLGLALSKHIMDRHNAEIRIQPAEGGGTIAQLVFPILSYSKGVADVQR
ncbi:MAG: sensor histidine kinase, partial [Ignavibacteriales bacterium]|nr:sensor histidine kinase [Ignavibacteriales bacterium]